mmetsp:Transcript_76417/g.229257  ORF Transcript_76417/g.229257 Transcript_76417/m.229257 type:complete len:202 (+) Transcript_76417:63-668(+)
MHATQRLHHDPPPVRSHRRSNSQPVNSGRSVSRFADGERVEPPRPSVALLCFRPGRLRLDLVQVDEADQPVPLPICREVRLQAVHAAVHGSLLDGVPPLHAVIPAPLDLCSNPGMQLLVQLGLSLLVGGEFGTAPVRLRQAPSPAVTTLVQRLEVPAAQLGHDCLAAILRPVERWAGLRNCFAGAQAMLQQEPLRLHLGRQ